MGITTDVRAACMSGRRIDTHAHLGERYGSPREIVARGTRFANSGGLVDSHVTAEGCRILYGTDVGAVLRPDVDPAVLDAADALRSGGAWQAVEHALDVAKIDVQIAFSGGRPANDRVFHDVANGRVRWLAYIDTALNGHGLWPCPDFPEEGEAHFLRSYVERLPAYFAHSGPLATMDDYLDALDAEIDAWRSYGVVGLKTAIAYTSGLAISDPTVDEARASFARGDRMTMADFRAVHDRAFHHILRALMRNGLPCVIHTGFQIWGHANLAQSNPMLLHNLIADKRYRDLVFVLLHGGNPYVGETTYLSGMFENVHIDFTWIGYMTPARFRSALAEWLACVPHHRMCWGSDSCTPETIVGVDSIMRRLIADTLDECVRDRTIDERYALEFVDYAFRETPRRLFGV